MKYGPQFTILNLILIVAVTCLTLAWHLERTRNMREEQKLRQTAQIQQANYVNALHAMNRNSNAKVELEHFAALSSAGVESFDVMLDARRRMVQSEIAMKVATHKVQDPNADMEAINEAIGSQMASVIRRELDFYRSWIGKAERDPEFDATELKQVRKQLDYFETELAQWETEETKKATE